VQPELLALYREIFPSYFDYLLGLAALLWVLNYIRKQAHELIEHLVDLFRRDSR